MTETGLQHTLQRWKEACLWSRPRTCILGASQTAQRRQPTSQTARRRQPRANVGRIFCVFCEHPDAATRDPSPSVNTPVLQTCNPIHTRWSHLAPPRAVLHTHRAPVPRLHAMRARCAYSPHPPRTNVQALHLHPALTLAGRLGQCPLHISPRPRLCWDAARCISPHVTCRCTVACNDPVTRLCRVCKSVPCP